MENIIQMLIPLLIVILTFVLGNRRRRTQGDAERETEENAVPEGDVAPPPFMENFPFEAQMEDMILQEDEIEEPPVAEEPEPVAVQEPVEPQPPPVPVESPAGIRSVPATALLDLSPSTFRQGIILREILGRPRSLQRRAPFRDRQDF